MNVVVSGLDVHKDYTYATILGPDGEKLAWKLLLLGVLVTIV